MTNYNTTTLSNGLRVIHLPSTSPVVYCGIGINAGARQEAEGEEGVAHFCEHITFKGTQRRSALQILNCLESVGGDLNAFTNKEDTIFYAAILKEHLSRAVDLLTDIVFNSESRVIMILLQNLFTMNSRISCLVAIPLDIIY